MDFELSQELKMLQEMTYRFALKEFTPVSKEADKEEKYTPEILKKAAQQGLAGAWIPEEYGGAGVGFLGNCIIHEQLARVDLGLCLNAACPSFGSEAIYLYGTEEQKSKYLPSICTGELISAGAYSEPNADTDSAGYQTHAMVTSMNTRFRSFTETPRY